MTRIERAEPRSAPTPCSTPTARWRVLVGVPGLALAVVAITTPHLLGQAGDRAEKRLLAEWAASGESLEQFIARRPPAGDNASALEVERLAAPCGFELAPIGSGRQWPTGQPPGWRLHESHEELLRSASGQCQLPWELEHWFHVSREPVYALVRHLTSAEPPRWRRQLASDWSALSAPSAPRMKEIRDLKRMLAVRAAWHASQGRSEQAHGDLEATWVLGQSMLERREDGATSCGVGCLRSACAVLRRLPDAPGAWDARLSSLALEEVVIDSWRTSCWEAIHLSRQPSPLEAAWEAEGCPRELLSRHRLAWGAQAPWARWRILQLAREHRALQREWLRADPCALEIEPDPPAEAVSDAMNPLGMRPRATLLVQVRQLQVDMALTRRVLALRRGAEPADARLPCSSWEIVQSPLPGGRTLLEVTGRLPLAPDETLLPTSVVVPPYD